MNEKIMKLDDVPQLVSITSITAEGILTLRKAVRQYLGLNGKRKLYHKTNGEIILSTRPGKGKLIDIDSKNRICLHKDMLNLLGIKNKMQIALVERGNAVAIKTFRIVEEQGKHARFFDIETSYNIDRKVETNPPIEQFLPLLVDRSKSTKLRYDLHAFLKNRNKV